MKNLNNILKHLFSKAIDIDKILSLDDLFSTKNEINPVSSPILYAKEELEDISSKKQFLLDSALDDDRDEEKDIYDLILDKAKYFLRFDVDNPICRYEHLLEWRELSFHLGQDLFTCAYNGYKSNCTTDLSWSPIAKNDNRKLNNLLEKGVAENHFHLKGSTQIFPLNWINIMNNPFSRNKEIYDLKSDDKYDVGFTNFAYAKKLEKVENIAGEFLTAANIRLYLYMKYCLKKDRHISYDGKIDFTEITDFSTELSVAREKYGVEILPNRAYVFDYAINIIKVKNDDNLILTGERSIMSCVFEAIFKNKNNSDDLNMSEVDKKTFRDKNASISHDKLLFYKYLLIKNKCREIFIQRNEIDGFDNFSNYEHRKEIFIDGNLFYTKLLSKLAINTTVSNQSIKSLEARLSPKNNSFAMKDKINEYLDVKEEFYRTNGENNFRKSVEEVDLFFVLHFPKFTEDRCVKDDKSVDFRNMKTRQGLSNTMMPIASFFKNFENAKFVKGIDTCNQEMLCRPEVFGYAYRFLLSDDIVDEDDKSVNLMATYHVGEDYFSLFDGLRAIHELLTFLNYKRGCRLGHALVLGVDPESYYKKNEYKIIMPKQNLLDNFVWLLNICEDADINITSSFRKNIEDKSRNLLDEIYYYTMKKIDENFAKEIENGKNESNSSRKPRSIMSGYSHNILQDYYDSMYLRSDYYRLFRLNYEEYERCSSNHFLIEERYFLYDNENKYRHRNPNSFEFCKDYITNEDIRYNGDKYEEYEIEAEFRQEVIFIAKELQRYYAEKLIERGIGIETNPSSNYLIGPIDRYIEHPIFRFNCRGLNNKSSDLPSLSVSINTDDQGVFDTYIENEYALIALALEKEMKESKSYEVEDIYEYLDYIRKQGFEQAFK